jgi:hypothetical protein
MRRRRRFSPLMLIGVGVTLVVALIGAGVFVVLPLINSHAAAAANPNCTIIIPNNPLSAQGLATPYQLVATNPGNGACNEANPNQSAFVQADILNPATGQISAYEPLVIDQGTKPAIAPVVPTLPAGAVVGIWFGFNGTILAQQQNARAGGRGGRGNRFNGQMFTRGGANGNCVGGAPGSPFGQFSYCNAVNFFQAANTAIQAGKITVPALGTANDGKPCMTTRDFGMVDMDQSDNVQTKYLTINGQTAQFSAANQAQLQNATVIANPSDNALLTAFLDPALGCTPWTVPDLANNNTPTATYGTDELMAAADQQAPVALIPAGDEMVLVNNNPSLTKTNLYRAGADQTPAQSLNGASTTTYCQNLVTVALPRLKLDMANFQNQTSPDGGAATNSLFTFLANRMNATFGAGGLNCVGLLNIQNPITLTTDGNGIVTAATILTTPLPATGNGNGNGNGGTTTTTNVATGTITTTLNANAGNARVAINLNIANFVHKQFFVNITDTANNQQVLHQSENTNHNGARTTTTVINGLQGLTAIPATWVATVTDANGNTLGSAPVVSNGTTGTATLTSTGTAGATPTTTTTTGTPAAGTTPTVTATGTPAAGTTPAATGTPAAGTTPTTTGTPTHHHHP